MDPIRDNPFNRFKSYILGLGVLLLFAVLLAVISLFVRSKPNSLEDAQAAVRYETKAQIDEAQATALSKESVDKAMVQVAAKLVSTKAVAVELPEQIVPGSATALALADAPEVDTSAIDAASAAAADEPIDPAVIELGKMQFMVCGACHGAEGEGTLAGPPLAGSEWVTGPVSTLIQIQLRGLSGPITVGGKEYEFPAGMAAMAYQDDAQVAAVLTYVRQKFGDGASQVKPEQVAALRSEVGKPPLVAEEVKQPEQ